jgi:hypothetical protein
MFKKVDVLKTNDYSLFNLFSFNREIKQSHVKELVESMKKYGFQGSLQVVYTSCIDGVKRYYVADGQHRLFAAKQLGLPIKFEIVKLKTKKECINFVAELNTTSSGWVSANFLDSFSDLGTSEYVKLKVLQKETGFQLTPLLEAFLFSSDQKAYRKGEMKFPNEKHSLEIINQMIDLNNYLPSKAFCRRAIVRVMRNPKYNHKKMLNAIKEYNKLVGSFTENERGLKVELERLLEKNC